MMDKEKGLARLMRICSVCEKCRKDALTSLERWEVDPKEHSEIVDYLIENKYIDERRYAKAFIRDKSNYSNWGETKIKMALRAKGISAELINEYIGEINPKSMEQKIKKALETKMRSIKYKDKYDLRNKLLRFASSRGYSMDVVYKFIGESEF